MTFQSLFQRLPASSHIAKALVGLSVAALLHAFLRRRAVQRIKDEITSSLSSQHGLLLDEDVSIESSRENKGEQEVLLKEQLSRNYAFLGNEKQDIVCQSFVVVVGLGGVGSHAAHMLLRSGVQHIRLIDFDQVTLSSLNRHAVATRADVGLSKVETMKKRLLDILPQANIETCNMLFEKDSAPGLLAGTPDFVLDCIDNVNTKVDLLEACVVRGIKVLSSMGSGAKADPTRIQIADISETFEDPLARATRRGLRLRGITSGIPVVYSIEKPGQVSLLPLDDDKLKEASEFSPLPDFRVRILPVLGTLPALFGTTMASYVITKLVDWPMEPLAYKGRDKVYVRLQRDMLVSERRLAGKDVPIGLSATDIGFLFEEIWRGRSAISGVFEKLVLIRWDASKPLAYGNIVCMTRQEAAEHDTLSSMEQVEAHYHPDILAYIQRRIQKEKEENEWRLHY